MRELLARVSIWSVCVLAVSAAPAHVLLAIVPDAQGADAGQSQKDEKPAKFTADPKAPIKPKRSDFATLEAYEAAKDEYYEDLTDYKVKQATTAEKQRADDLERRLAALESGKKTQGAGAGQNVTPPGDSTPPVKPRREDFGTPEAYEAARDKYYEDLTDYKVKQATTAEKQRADELERRLAALESGKKTQGADAGQNQTVISDILSRIKIFGTVKLDVIYNDKRPQAPGVPFFLVPKFAGGFSQQTLDINARQSLLGVLFTGPNIGSFQTGGRISAVFFDPSVLADKYGFLLQQSYAELFNDHWRLAAGLQFDVFAPGLPTVLPFSYLGGSGSPGNCIRGQIRVEHFSDVGSDSQLTLQGALSQPLNTAVTPDIVLDEDNGWPNVEGRIALGLGKPAPIGLLTQRPVEVGVSGLVGQLRRTADPFAPPRRVVSDVWGVALDFRVNLASRFGFKGEVYTGQALGNYNGGILQSLDAVTWKAIRGSGGFVEGFVYWTPALHTHAGIGIDHANKDDITTLPNTLFGRTYNSTVYGNLLWDLNTKFRVAVEATYRKTEYKDAISTGRFDNEGFGFHTQFAWTF